MVDCHEIFMVIFQEIQHLALYTMWYAFFPLVLLFIFFTVMFLTKRYGLCAMLFTLKTVILCIFPFFLSPHPPGLGTLVSVQSGV